GKAWPPTDAAFLAEINQQRADTRDFRPVTAFQIQLQMAHRILALAILLAVCQVAWAARKLLPRWHAVSTLALLWLGLILGQIFLGAATIWSNKAADIATAHVVAGAASLVTGALVTILVFGFCRAARGDPSPVRDRSAAGVSELEH